MKKLYLIRHGETEFNVKGLCQGQKDSPLTQKGIKQAVAIKKEIEKLDLKFDYVFSSPLQRSIDTTNIVLNRNDIQILDELKEITFGDYEGKSNLLMPRPLGGELAKSYNGETTEELFNRVYYAIKKTMDLLPDNTSTIMFTHGFVMRTIDNYITNNLDNIFFPANCSLYVYEYENDIFNKVKTIDNPIAIPIKE